MGDIMLAKIAATPIGDLPLRDPVRVGPDTALIDVVTALRERRRGAAIIEDAGGKILGIFTERDLMLRIEHSSHAWHRQPVKEVMTPDPRPVSVDEPLATALRRMKEGSFRRLPVVGKDGTLVGLLSIRDIVRYIAERFPAEFINLPPDPGHEAHHRWGG